MSEIVSKEEFKLKHALAIGAVAIAAMILVQRNFLGIGNIVNKIAAIVPVTPAVVQ